MARGGIRPGAGRKKGSKSSKNLEIAKAALAEGVTPLEYMLNVLRDEKADDQTKRWAAEKAAPYVHPRLNSIDIGNKDGKPFVIQALPEDVGIL